MGPKDVSSIVDEPSGKAASKIRHDQPDLERSVNKFFSRNDSTIRRCQHSGQIFSFVQRSRGFDSHALVRSQYLLILTNQVPSLCLLPRFAAKLWPFLTVLTTIPKKNIARSGKAIFI